MNLAAEVAEREGLLKGIALPPPSFGSTLSSPHYGFETFLPACKPTVAVFGTDTFGYKQLFKQALRLRNMTKMSRKWKAPGCDPVAQGDPEALKQLNSFLERFKYGSHDDVSSGVGDVQSALAEYQSEANLPQTGLYDKATAEHMENPRCGVSDRRSLASFEVLSTSWDRFRLTYRFDTFCADLTDEQVTQTIRAAFDQWTEVSPFTFVQVPQGQVADIRIGWYGRDHVDGSPFDGPGTVIAHAFGPPPGSDLAGDVHFDEDETWTTILLGNAALHEIGHALGLDHSGVAGAVMQRTVPSTPALRLSSDDVAGIQSIYGGFRPVYAEGDPGHGIGGYDLRHKTDQVFAFDYDHSGKLDHLCLYRPGTGTFWILSHNQSDGTFSAVYLEGDPGIGIGGYDLRSPLDKAFAFDYDHSGKLDHICLYRPGTGTFWILRNAGGVFSAVYAQGDPGIGIGSYDLRSPGDRAFAFDYDHSGKLDHICLYRPGTGTFWILRNAGGVFSAVYAQGDPGIGIGGYDLRSPGDKAFAFDYDHSGKLDHICLYRPGTGTFWILRHDVGGTFSAVYAQGDPGIGIGGYNLDSGSDLACAYDNDKLVLYRPGRGAIFILGNEGGVFRHVYARGDPGNGLGGYNFKSPDDRVLSFDYNSSGKLDHLVFIRPGTGTVWILKRLRAA
jgi:hypothetical protein